MLLQAFVLFTPASRGGERSLPTANQSRPPVTSPGRWLFWPALWAFLAPISLPWVAVAASLDPGPPMTTARMGHYIIGLPDGRVALPGGHGSGFEALSSMDVWTPSGNDFANVSLPFVFDMGALVRLADGRYLLAGGAADLGVAPGYASAALLDPTNATVSSTGSSMTQARMMCKGVQLAGGKVLIVGGWYDAGSSAQGEIFDPVSATFSATGPLNTPRSVPLVFPTVDGKAVVVGGLDPYGSSTLASVELYDPTTNGFSLLANSAIEGEPGWVYKATEYGEDFSRFKTGDGYYVFPMSQTTNGVVEYALALFDPATKQFSKLALSPAFWGSRGVWPPVVDATNNRALMLAGSNPDGGADLTFQIYQVDLATGQALAVSGMLTVSNYYLGSSGITLLRDGRLFVTGGTGSIDYGYNFSPATNTFFVSGINPPPQIQLPNISGRQISFALRGAVGGVFQIQSAAGLDLGNQWQAVDTVTLTNWVQHWADPSPFTNTARFYRLVQTGP
jgi:hypothetical protein